MEQDLVMEIKSQLGESSKKTGLTTGKVRSVSSSVFKLIEDKNIDYVLDLCESLLEERKWEPGVIAYDWAYRMRKQYTPEIFQRFEQWLKRYVRGWGDCDDFCTHAFGELLGQYNSLFERVFEWTVHPDFWVRRASAVILIYPIRKGKMYEIDPFTIPDALMNDEHYLVLKGYGWMLKELSRSEPDAVYEYIMRNKVRMPRLSLRYAIEKFDKEKRAILMDR
jgi:3-methyladenine DNA glycosylase AlkD